MRLLIVGLLSCVSAIVFVYSVANAQTPIVDNETAVRQAKLFAGESGKNLCIDAAINNKAQAEHLRKNKVSVAALCGCVERELFTLVSVKFATTLLVEAQAADAQKDPSKISQSSVDQLTRLEGVANLDCFQKLMRP